MSDAILKAIKDLDVEVGRAPDTQAEKAILKAICLGVVVY
jgi:hypothetical protein